MLKERLAKIWARSVKQYRVVFYDQESLSQARNFRIKPLGIILAFLGVSLILIAGTTALIFSVPAIHKQIPGFKDPVEMQERYALLEEQNLLLEHEVEKLDTMLAAFSRVAGMNNPTPADREIWAAVTPAPEPADDNDASQDLQEPANAVDTPPELGRPIPSREYTPPSEYFNLIPPLDGIITKEFDQDEKAHYGIDIVADENSLIRSVSDGMVVFSEYSITTGHVIGIWHAKDNLVSFYKHNSKLFRQVGDFVFAGEAIAVIGNTGINSSGMHLHFELWYNNNPVDPGDYIVFN